MALIHFFIFFFNGLAWQLFLSLCLYLKFKIVKSYLWDTMVNEKVGLEFGMNLFMSSSRI